MKGYKSDSQKTRHNDDLMTDRFPTKELTEKRSRREEIPRFQIQIPTLISRIMQTDNSGMKKKLELDIFKDRC